MKAPRPRLRRQIATLLPACAGLGLLYFSLTTTPPESADQKNRPIHDAERLTAPPAERPGAAATPTDPPPIRELESFLEFLTGEFPFGRDRQGALREALESMSPAVVEALLRITFPDPDLNDITHVLLERLATQAPESALAFAREKSLGLDPPWWHSVIGGLADPRLASSAILALPPSDARTHFLGHLTFQLGLADPQAALNYALSDTPGEARGVALANAIIATGRGDPEAGFDLSLRYASAAGDPGLIKILAVDWALNDYAAAAGRIQNLADGEPKQTALAGLASVAIERDPEGAPVLVSQIRDPEKRQDLYLQAAKRFYLHDPVQAETWLEHTPELSAENKTRVREFYRQSLRE